MKKTVRKANQKAEVKPAKIAPASASKKVTKPSSADTEMLELGQIKELIELIADKQFTDFELERGKFRLRLGRGSTPKAAPETIHYVAAMPEVAPPASVPLPVPLAAVQPPSAAPAPPAAQEENLHIITSPIVGTFYRASSPNAAPFASVGDTITQGKTLCIIEAMKLMNEINSDISGTVARSWNTVWIPR